MTLAGVCVMAAPAKVSVGGVVVDDASKTPLPGVVISIGEDYLWAVTDEKGSFSVQGVRPGRYIFKASCIGYVEWETELDLKEDTLNLNVSLKEQSLALDEVVVTARRTDGSNTTHTIGRDALNHLQMSNVADMASLLPGGKTVNPDLTSGSQLSIRDGGAGDGNAAFGTAVEVDGVRLGNNAGFAQPSGVDTRNISVDNVESVEVISGVPSAEYGDLGSGMVRVHTKKGRTPVNITFSVNPRTYQASVSKGLDLGEDRGVLNMSAEWARATKKLTSPYESYTRRTVSLAYSNTFAKVLRFEISASGNIGGMDTKDDPDAFTGAYGKVNDNVVRGSTSLTWQLNLPWITNLRADASVNYNDNRSLDHSYNSNAAQMPAVHSEREGYFLASRLPNTYFSDQIVDSKELDLSASLRYTWIESWDKIKNHVKAGVQWKANGNVGRGEYYLNPELSANGYRPRPYTDYPFMHNLSVYAEDEITLPIGKTSLLLSAGLRLENVFVKGSRYGNTNTLSPRFNAKWKLLPCLSVRGGWGVTEKLPSFYILYPRQEYLDIRTFDFSHGDGSTSSYVYYTRPYSIEYNPNLRWQRNYNSEFGIDFEKGGWKVSAVGFYNLTRMPYRLNDSYVPFSYSVLALPAGYKVPDNPLIYVDEKNGDVFLRGSEAEAWKQMDVKVNDRSFVRNTFQDNGDDIRRAGVEFTLECPQINAIRTSLRLDMSYNYTHTEDRSLSYSYNIGWSHTSLPNRSYQYVGIYANGGNSGLACGKKTHRLDANLTAITHIPQAKLVITCRLEASLLTRMQNIPAQGTDVLMPVSYMDLDGQTHDFTSEMASDPQFSYLIRKPNNDYVFAPDGYAPYLSANLSITKEIGKHVSLSFFANNFTNSRPTVYSMATGVGAIFTPAFYYGLTCRVKF